MRMNRNWRRPAVFAAAVTAVALALAGCDTLQNPAAQDAARSAASTGDLISKQPVEAGKYSPTRAQINNWNKTWQSAPGKLAYTYLFRMGTDEPLGYYVLVGPPVNYAAGATQPYRVECNGSGSSCVTLPNPGQDGAFYNTGSGTNQFYGTDAQSGRILEWGGDGISYLLSDAPLRLTAPPLGDAVIGQGKIK